MTALLDRDTKYLAWIRGRAEPGGWIAEQPDEKLLQGLDYDAWCAAWALSAGRPAEVRRPTDREVLDAYEAWATAARDEDHEPYESWCQATTWALTHWQPEPMVLRSESCACRYVAGAGFYPCDHQRENRANHDTERFNAHLCVAFEFYRFADDTPPDPAPSSLAWWADYFNVSEDDIHIGVFATFEDKRLYLRWRDGQLVAEPVEAD